MITKKADFLNLFDWSICSHHLKEKYTKHVFFNSKMMQISVREKEIISISSKINFKKSDSSKRSSTKAVMISQITTACFHICHATTWNFLWFAFQFLLIFFYFEAGEVAFLSENQYTAWNGQCSMWSCKMQVLILDNNSQLESLRMLDSKYWPIWAE